jgi:hypothetical protein
MLALLTMRVDSGSALFHAIAVVLSTQSKHSNPAASGAVAAC